MSEVKKSYVDMQIEDIAASKEISFDEAKREYLKNSEHVTRLEEYAPQEHIWVDRGQVMSCEGAAHPNHRVFKRR